MSRNAYDIIFRVVELGVALWFPCVLWNCMSPEQLWILNPKKILKKLDIDRSLELGQKVPQKSECYMMVEIRVLVNKDFVNSCRCKLASWSVLLGVRSNL